MPLDAARARQLLKECNLRTLFIEELGWDRYAERIQIPLGAQTFQLEGVAHKRDLAVFRCAPATGGGIPPRSERLKIDRAIAKLRFEHIIIYSDGAQTTQVWQWVKREAGKPAACREHNVLAAPDRRVADSEASAHRLQPRGRGRAEPLWVTADRCGIRRRGASPSVSTTASGRNTQPSWTSSRVYRMTRCSAGMPR